MKPKPPQGRFTQAHSHISLYPAKEVERYVREVEALYDALRNYLIEAKRGRILILTNGGYDEPTVETLANELLEVYLT